jgi:hypothetical protein
MLAGHATALGCRLPRGGRLDAGTPSTVDADGRLHVAALSAVPDPASLVDLRRWVEAMLPRIDLPDLVLEVMSWHPQFVEAFTHTSGNEAHVADLGLSVAAVLCAHAMNVGFAPVTTPGGEALTRDRLHHVDQNYLRFETMAAANVPLVEPQAEIELAQAWGGGLVASLDGLRFVVPVRTPYARPKPKYFGRKRGITWLNMINDQAAGLAAKVLSSTSRDSLQAVDVVLRITQHWEDMCRVAVSIHSSEVSAHEVTRMISRDGNPTSLRGTVIGSRFVPCDRLLRRRAGSSLLPGSGKIREYVPGHLGCRRHHIVAEGVVVAHLTSERIE